MARTAPARLFKCLSEGLRLRLVRLLAHEELSVGELVDILDVPQSTLSRHLSILREGGLLSTRRQGSFSFYRLHAPADLEGTGDALLELLESMLADDEHAAVDRRGLEQVLEARRNKSRDHFEHAGHTWDDFQAAHADHDVKQHVLARMVPRDLLFCDVGTGSGYLLPELVAAGARVIGVDHAPSQLTKARERARREGWHDVEFREGDIAALPLADGEVDGVFAHLALHHAPNPRAALRDMKRVLKPGGTLVLSDFVAHEQTWLADEHADHWLGFDPAEVRSWLESEGFTGLRLEIRPFSRDDVERSPLVKGLDVFVLSGRRPQQPLGADR